MDDELIAKVRRFNRTVAQRIGALDDRYLSRDLPLGEARVLWEIGESGCELRRLRAHLDLDSGYLSRLLRSLEGAGLVTVEPSAGDRRVRTARLTKRGLAERRILDRRSDELAASMLDALPDDDRQRLVAAMADVERLLTRAQIAIEPVDPADPTAQHCLREYYAELDRRFGRGYDPEQARPVDLDEMRVPAGTFLVATLHDEPVACGALKRSGERHVEVKRMWVSPAVRGMGVGRWLLGELERTAAAMGAAAVRLDSNSALVEAIAMYRSAGYREVPDFNGEPYADHWFEKPLTGS